MDAGGSSSTGYVGYTYDIYIAYSRGASFSHALKSLI